MRSDHAACSPCDLLAFHGARPAACALGRAPLSRPARGGGRLAGAAARLSLLVLLPHGRASRATGRRRSVRGWRSRSSASAAWHASRPWPGRGRSSAASATPTAAGKCSRRRPRPIDLIVGRSAGLGSTLFAPVYAPAAPGSTSSITTTTPARTTWPTSRRRRSGLLSLAAVEARDRPPRPGAGDLAWTPTHWQRQLFPAEYRDDLGSCTTASTRPAPGDVAWRDQADGRGRSPAGRLARRHRASSASWPGRSTGCAGSTDSWQSANALLRAAPDVLCASWAIRSSGAAWMSSSTTGITPRTSATLSRRSIPIGSGSWGRRHPATVAEVLAASDLHSPRPVLSGRSLAARGDGRRLRRAGLRHRAASRSRQPRPNRSCWSTVADPDALCAQALAVLATRRPTGRWAMRRPSWSRALCARMSASPARRAVRDAGRRARKEVRPERPVHPRRLPRPVRPARPRADPAPRLAVQLPGAEPLELPDPTPRCSKRSSCTRCP